jgi:aspartyl-tRNA(Asn)/glutamyl-tRNA(Gln) amidotransferase subunit A
MQLHQLTIHEAQALLQKKEISARELTGSVLDRIQVVEPKIDAYLTVAADMALKQAQAADQMISSGKNPPLCGIPLAIKDLICTEGLPTTCASRILENFVPPYDATVMQKTQSRRCGDYRKDEHG